MSPEEVAGVWGWFEADEEDYVKRYKEIETLENWVQANTEWGMSEDKWRIVKTAQLEITDKRAALESTVVPIGSPLRSILTAKDSSLYKPHTSLQVQDQQFYVSKVLLGGGAVRPMAILYTTNPEKLYVARLLYKSKSDGGWRMAPYVKQDGVLSKGLIHYTQETKLCHEIERLLELFERDKTTIKVTEDVSEFFKTPLIGGVNVLTAFQREVDSYKSSDPSIFTALQTIIRYQPGVVFVGQSNTDVVKWMIELPEEINLSLQNSMLQRFVPDFSKKAVHSYEFTHTLLGLTKVDVYEGVLDGQKVHWHMASDQEQRVWIERIYFPHIPISTYGVSTQFLNSGILTSKPLEYREQSGLLAKVTYRDGSTGQQEFQGSSTYVDITGFLDQLAPIQAYRAAKKILRGPGSVGLKILPSG
jgi:hypothetical protein